MLEIDPVTKTATTFGNLGSSHSDVECSGSTHCGEEKWIGGVLVPSSGKIIGIPYAAESVLEIDPVARTTTTFGIVSSSVKRKWLDGVMGRNGLIYAIPYDADVVLEIDPDTHALMLFGRVGGDPCKWYGGVLGPNDKIYAIPYSSPYVHEIDPERRIARPFAMTYPHWAKWSGGVLAPNGKIYVRTCFPPCPPPPCARSGLIHAMRGSIHSDQGIPALSKSVLEIDVEREQTSLFGMLPGGNDLEDKWAGGVVAPNGKIYGMPWKSSSVLEFDPATKAIALLGSGIGSANYSWSGGVLAASGRIVAVPYNGAWVLEIGETVCTGGGAAPPPPPAAVAAQAVPVASKPPTVVDTAGLPGSIKGLVVRDQQFSQAPLPSASVAQILDITRNKPRASTAEPSRTFVLALLGCPDAAKASEDACFHLSHRTWHSAMVTIMDSESTLKDIRQQVEHSRLSHVPTNFCFLFNGHSLDPNVEGTIQASNVATVANPPDSTGTQYIVLIDNVHCNIDKMSFSDHLPASPSLMQFLVLCSICCSLGFFLYLGVYCRGQRRAKGATPYLYNRVPASAHEAQALMDVETNTDDKGVADCKRIPCLPHARLRPLFNKSTRRSPLSISSFKAHVASEKAEEATAS